MYWAIRLVAKSNAAKQYRKFVADSKNPELAQERVWQEIAEEVAESAFWKARGKSKKSFSSIANFEITDYEDYRDAIQHSFQTGVSELSGKPVIYWSESSGTSGKRKIFPITPSYRRQFQSTTAPFLHSLFQKFPGFLRKKVLYFAGMNPKEKSPTQIDVGFISNFNYRHIPKLIQKAYAFPPSVLRDWPTFEKWAPAYALQQDLSAMIAITPSVPTKFAETISQNRDFYLEVLRGKIQPPEGLPEIKCSVSRFQKIQQAFAREQILFAELWPGLQFLCCWQSSGCAMQLPALKKFSGALPLVDATYSATEGWVNVPSAEGVGGPVHPGAHCFEFLKRGEEAKAQNLLPLWKLEAGEVYEIFISNSMGLIRYRVYDLVLCTGHFERSPIIEFVQKSLNEIVLGMIRVSEDQILKALHEVKVTLSAQAYFSSNPEGNRLMLYQGPESNIEESQLRAIESCIIALNPYYARDIARGLLLPLASERLPAHHPNWQIQEHAQSKPKCIRI